MPAREPEPPSWADQIATPGERVPDATAALDTTIELATASAREGGGPFGALVADDGLEILAVGTNRVLEARDSTAHAEIEALRRAQHRLGTHDLSTTERGPLTLYASCAPCVMCFGAIYWSGLSRVVWAASAEDAERLGFQEGPVTEGMWDRARQDKGIEAQPQAVTDRDPTEPFRIYEELGGPVY